MRKQEDEPVEAEAAASDQGAMELSEEEEQRLVLEEALPPPKVASAEADDNQDEEDAAEYSENEEEASEQQNDDADDSLHPLFKIEKVPENGALLRKVPAASPCENAATAGELMEEMGTGNSSQNEYEEINYQNPEADLVMMA